MVLSTPTRVDNDGNATASRHLLTPSHWLASARRNALLCVVLFGALERALFCHLRHNSGSGGEAFNVAAALASGRGFADAYQIGQGATAHLMPTSPVIAGGVYAMLGIRSATSEIVLAAFSITLCLSSYVVLHRAFSIADRRAAAVALVGLCLIPAYVSQESVDYRVWDGGLIMLTSAVLIQAVMRIMADGGFQHDLAERRRPVSSRPPAAVRAVVALAALFFLNPIFGVAGAVALAIVSFEAHGARRASALLLTALALATALILPWTARNAAALGHPVPTRSNAGLEFALANHEGALNGDEAAIFEGRLAALHPVFSMRNLDRMRTGGGEVAYSNKLGARAADWARTHPLGFVRLCVRHMFELLAPPAWTFHMFGVGFAPGLRSAIASVVGLGGALSLGLLAFTDARFRPLAAMFVIVLLLMAPFQPVARYSCLLFGPLTFCLAHQLRGVVPSRGTPPAGRRTAERVLMEGI